METYAEFKGMLMKRLAEEGIGAELEVFTKENNVVKEAIVLKRSEGRTVSPILYLDSIFALFRDGGQDFGEIADYVVKTLKSPVSGLIEGICPTKGNILKSIVPTVVSKSGNRGREEYLADDFLDLAIVYRMLVRGEEFGEGLAALTEDILQREGVLGENGMSREELLSYAVANMRRLYTPEICSFSAEFWMITHKGGSYGAALILDTEYLVFLSGLLEGSYYILPSSKHELILLPERKVSDPESLPKLVREVNRTAVEKEDYLSDSVYFFDSQDKAVRLYR